MESRRSDRPLIGRLDLFQALVRRRDEVLSGHGGLSFLEGETGVGKSTMLSTLTDDSLQHDFRVISARSEPQAPAPFQLIRAVVRAVDREAAALGAFAAPSLAFPYVAQPLVTNSFAFGVGGAPATVLRAAVSGEATSLFRSVALGDTFQADRVQLMEELATPLFALADQVPVLIAIEDLQWTDEGSLEFLEYIEPRSGVPTGLVDWHDPTLRAARTPVRAGFERLVGSGASRFSVRPLNEREVVDFVRWASPTGRRRRAGASLVRADGRKPAVPGATDQRLARRGKRPNPSRRATPRSSSGTRSGRSRRPNGGFSRSPRFSGRRAGSRSSTGPRTKMKRRSPRPWNGWSTRACSGRPRTRSSSSSGTALREELSYGLTETDRRIFTDRVAEAIEASGPRRSTRCSRSPVTSTWVASTRSRSVQSPGRAVRRRCLPTGHGAGPLEARARGASAVRADHLDGGDRTCCWRWSGSSIGVGELDRAERAVRQITDGSDMMAADRPADGTCCRCTSPWSARTRADGTRPTIS